MKRTPLRARSQKMAALYVQRRKVVRDLLAERPWCQIRWDAGCQGMSVDVDEILSRAQGGSILDRDNLQTTCRHCHQQKHYNPTEADARGVTRFRRGGAA